MDQDRPANPAQSQEPAAPDVLSYANPNTGRMTSIARFEIATHAYLAAAKLESEGIVTRVGESLERALVGAAAWADLSVPMEDVNRAIEILADTPARKHLLAPPSQLPPARVLPVLSCPRCGGVQMHHQQRGLRVLLGMLLLLPLAWLGPLGIVWFTGLSLVWAIVWLWDRPLVCAQCGQIWRPEES